MHLIFLLTYSPRFYPPPESVQGFSIRPFPFALEAIEFQKFHLIFLKKILYYSKLTSFTVRNWHTGIKYEFKILYIPEILFYD